MGVAETLRDQILDAAARRATLRIRGGGSKDWYGGALVGEVLDTRDCSGIVAYEASELVITARCGTSLAEIEAALAEQGQMLAFEPPHFGAGATIGGVVASGLAGPRRASAGGVRDFVLGAVLMDGRGQVLHFGGQVMKNVAGYDVSRLLAGSLGTLGLILEVSLKVLPKPVCEDSLCFDVSEGEALRLMNEWGGQPLPISATSWHSGQLAVRLSGAQAAVADARRRLGGRPMDQALEHWAALREQTHSFFNGPAPVLRYATPPTAPALDKDETLIEWGGAQRWVRAVDDPVATLWRGGDKSSGVFPPLQPAVARIQRRLQDEFDPGHVFHRSRLYAD